MYMLTENNFLRYLSFLLYLSISSKFMLNSSSAFAWSLRISHERKESNMNRGQPPIRTYALKKLWQVILGSYPLSISSCKTTRQINGIIMIYYSISLILCSLAIQFICKYCKRHVCSSFIIIPFKHVP